MNRIYTGIGARKTPAVVLGLMTQIAKKLDTQGWQLSTGNAKGADSAFASGATNPMVYHPNQVDYEKHAWAVTLAAQCCREYPLSQMSPYIQRLMIRNMFQLFGMDQQYRTQFVICWTPTLDPCHPKAGGTRIACRAAVNAGIQVFNLNNPRHRVRMNRFLKG